MARNYFANLFRRNKIKTIKESPIPKKFVKKTLEDIVTIAKTNARMLTKNEIAFINDLKDERNKNYNAKLHNDNQTLEDLRNGKFDNYSNMTDIGRAVAAYEHQENFKQLITAQGFDLTEANVENIAQALVQQGNDISYEHALDPRNRKILACMANDKNLSQEQRGFYDKLDRELTHQVTLGTFKQVSVENQERTKTDFHLAFGTQFNKFRAEQLKNWPGRQWANSPQNEDIAAIRHSLQQKSMLKLFAMSQVGDFTVQMEKDQPVSERNPWETNMSSLFGNGGRIQYVFPKNESGSPIYAQDLVFGNAVAKDYMENHEAILFNRKAATHGMIRAIDKADQPSLKGLKEKHGFIEAGRGALGLSSTKNYGMDLAVGGLGAKGIGGATIVNDGRNGHTYVGIKPQSGDKKSVLLVGVESDAPYRTNPMGHLHTMRANPEDEASSGGAKTQLIGEKYGGRIVDLSAINPEHLKMICQKIDAMNPLQVENASKSLLGKPMNRDELQTCLISDIGIEENMAKQIADDRAIGIQARKDNKSIEASKQELGINAPETRKLTSFQKLAQKVGLHQKQTNVAKQTGVSKESKVAEQKGPEIK